MKDIDLKYGTVMEQEPACCIFEDLLGCGRIVDYDWGQHGIHLSAHPKIQVTF